MLFLNVSKTSHINKIVGDLANEQISFSEVIFFKRNTSIWILGEFEAVTHIKKIGDDSFKFTPQLCALEIHLAPYLKNVKVGDKWDKREAKPTTEEKALKHILTQDFNTIKTDGSQAYSGLICFEDDADIYSGITQGNTNLYKYYFPKLDEVPKTEKTQDIENIYDFGEKKDGFAGGGRTYKSQADIADERLAWLIKQLQLETVIESNKAKGNSNFQELCFYLEELNKINPDMVAIIWKVFSSCMK